VMVTDDRSPELRGGGWSGEGEDGAVHNGPLAFRSFTTSRPLRH